MKQTTVFIVISGDTPQTYGAFTSKQAAEKALKELYVNGYFGPLTICEDELTYDRN